MSVSHVDWEGATEIDSPCRLDARLREWLNAVLAVHLPASTAGKSEATKEEDSEIVLAATHEDCIVSLRDVLLAVDPEIKVADTEVVPGLDTTCRPMNSKLVKIRFWREGGGGGSTSVIRARFETWAK